MGKTEDQNIELKATLIRDGIISASYNLPDSEVFLYPFIDYLYLYFQRPLVFNFWNKKECIFSSLSDPFFTKGLNMSWDRAPQKMISLPNISYRLSIHRFDANAIFETMRKKELGRNKSGTSVLPTDETAMEQAEFVLTGNIKNALDMDDQVFELLDKSLKRYSLKSEKGRRGRSSIKPLKLSYEDDTLNLLSGMRKVLDEAFSDASASPMLKIKISNTEIANIFAVVRTVPSQINRYHNKFNYTAGLLLSNEQLSSLEHWAGLKCTSNSDQRSAPCILKGNAEECIRYLQYPLGRNSRSVSDLVFSSGLVDFGREAGEIIWDESIGKDLNDEKRRAVESCLYPQGGRLFYTPIHVNGTPWLAIFTFNKEDPTQKWKTWRLNYGFYRDVIHRAAEIIRRAAKKLYLQLIQDKLQEAIKSWATPLNVIARNVSKEWQKLAQTFPFPLARLAIRKSANSEKLEVPSRGVFWIDISEGNPFFTQHVDWKVCDSAEIISKCREATMSYSQIESYLEQNATAHTSHLLKVPLRDLRSIALKEGSPEVREKLNKQISSILNLHETATCMVSEKKRQDLRKNYLEADANQFKAILDSRLNDRINDGSIRSLKKPDELEGRKINDYININLKLLDSLRGKNIKYFRNQLTMTIDEMFSNALKYIDATHPTIDIYLEVIASLKGKLIFLVIDNSVSLSNKSLPEIVNNMNLGGPDIVGITTMHWACRACWDTKPLWQTSKKEKHQTLRALIPIGGIEA